MLAATLSPTYGLYSGLRALRERAGAAGFEEYLHSEKYEIKQRALDGPLLPMIARLNQIRRENAPLQELSNITFLDTHNDALIAYAKQTRGETIICVVNLDPHQGHQGVAVIPASLGLPPTFTVHDTLSDERYQWRIGHNYVALAPGARQAHVLRVSDERRTPDADAPARPRTTLRRRRNLGVDHGAQPGLPLVRGRAPVVQAAIIYEIHIRGFFDSNGDGRVTSAVSSRSSSTSSGSGSTASGSCRSTSPRCATTAMTSPTSPAMHPDYGTVDDFQDLVDAAHARHPGHHRPGDEPHVERPRVVSGEPHRRPRQSQAGLVRVEDTDERYQDARIIFTDTEVSNWTWDPVAKRYFWHRFFSHQPDLNYDNPEVHEAMMQNVLRFWLDRGVDGFRLDAVPYLFEREGTSCENLSETHAYLKKVRKARSTPITRTGYCWPRPTSGRPTSSSTSATATSARCASTSR